MYGAFAGFAVHTLSQPTLIAIEDYFFGHYNEQLRLTQDEMKVFTLPDVLVSGTNIDEYTILVEFALALLAIDGHPSLSVAAAFSGESCILAKRIHYENETTECRFATRVNGAAAQWMCQCYLAHKSLKERFHVTAHRYVKYARSRNDPDALLDLCISLESLLDTQTEIAFRFAASLSKVTGAKGDKAEELAGMLSDLYEIRSKIVHGDHQVGKLMKKLEPKLPDLHQLARKVLITYILFSSEKSRDAWKTHLRSSIFA